MEEHKTNDPMHMEPLMELPSPLEDKDAVHLHAISVRLFSTPTEVEAILPTMDPMDLPEAMVDLVEVLEEDPEEVTEDLAEVPEEDPEEVAVDPPMEEAMGDTPMAEPEARMEVVAVELETHMEVVVADLETLMEVTVEETMILTDTTSDSMMAASLGELKSSPSRSPRP